MWALESVEGVAERVAVDKLVVQALYKEADTLTDPSLLVMGLGVTAGSG